jgi:hypothetical protein
VDDPGFGRWKHGVKLLTEHIIGSPGETIESAMRTLEVNVRLRPDIADAFLFTTYPKIPLMRTPLTRIFRRRFRPFGREVSDDPAGFPPYPEAFYFFLPSIDGYPSPSTGRPPRK